MKTYGNDHKSNSWDIKTVKPAKVLPNRESVTYSGGVKIVMWSDGEVIHNVSYEYVNGRWDCKGDKTISISEYNKRYLNSNLDS